MKIGISLSGGGVRATVFHLGVLKRIAESDRWSDITFLSTVSGGSLCAALVFHKSGKRWPTSGEYLHACLPEIRNLLTSFCLESAYKRRLFIAPWKFLSGRAAVIARLLREKWEITADVNEMPELPRWQICTTCYETGKSWRFSRERMGDYLTNYVNNPAFPLAEAVAASAAVPGLIGPLRVQTSTYKWHKYGKNGSAPTEPVEPASAYYTLWDGGVYENLGVESLFKPSEGLREGIDFIVVSDASKGLGIESRRFQLGMPPYIPPFRLVDIATDQTRALRLRTVFQFLQNNPSSGMILRMGNSVEGILSTAKAEFPSNRSDKYFLTPEAVATAADFPTTLRQLSGEEFDLLLRHGYEVTDLTLHSYKHNAFRLTASKPLS